MWENRTEPMQEHKWWKLHGASWLLVFCAVVWCCCCWWWSEWWKKQSKHIHIRTAFSTTRIHKENKQVLPYQPTLLKTLTNIIYCMCLFQHVGKQDRTHARTQMVKIAWRKLVAGILCGCVVLLVAGGEVSDEKNNPNTSIFELHFFTTRIHKENKQVLPYQPTLLKTLTNII